MFVFIVGVILNFITSFALRVSPFSVIKKNSMLFSVSYKILGPIIRFLKKPFSVITIGDSRSPNLAYILNPLEPELFFMKNSP